MIAFVGSVFSPYYAWARRRRSTDPLEHCSLNVALYGGRRKRWALTERRRDAVHRERETLSIGPSALSWDRNGLTVRIDEWTVPVPSRIRGVVRLRPEALAGETCFLDADRRHRWRPIAPCARVEVALEQPALHWMGEAYMDSNHGDAPLEDAFVRWDWSRSKHGDRATSVLYDVTRRDGGAFGLAKRFGPTGTVHDFPPPPPVSLPKTRWRVERATRTDAGSSAAVVQTLEDAPFYARSVLRTQLLGERVETLHESLSLDRFRQRWVQALLPFRTPRTLR